MQEAGGDGGHPHDGREAQKLARLRLRCLEPVVGEAVEQADDALGHHALYELLGVRCA